MCSITGKWFGMTPVKVGYRNFSIISFQHGKGVNHEMPEMQREDVQREVL